MNDEQMGVFSDEGSVDLGAGLQMSYSVYKDGTYIFASNTAEGDTIDNIVEAAKLISKKDKKSVSFTFQGSKVTIDCSSPGLTTFHANDRISKMIEGILFPDAGKKRDFIFKWVNKKGRQLQEILSKISKESQGSKPYENPTESETLAESIFITAWDIDAFNKSGINEDGVLADYVTLSTDVRDLANELYVEAADENVNFSDYDEALQFLINYLQAKLKGTT